MKTKRMIDEQRILNIITAAKFVSLGFGDVADNVLASSLKGESGRFAKEAMIMGWNFVKVKSAMEDNHGTND